MRPVDNEHVSTYRIVYSMCVCVRVCRNTGAGVWHDLFNPHALLIKEWACSWVLAVAQKCELIGGLEALFPNDFPQSVQAFLFTGVWSIVPMTIQWLSLSVQQIVAFEALFPNDYPQSVQAFLFNGVWSIVPMTIQWLSLSVQQIVSVWSIVPQWLSPISSSIFVQWCLKHCSNDYPMTIPISSANS